MCMQLQAGPLTRVNLPRAEGSDTGAHRGYGFAQYTTVVSASQIVIVVVVRSDDIRGLGMPDSGNINF